MTNFHNPYHFVPLNGDASQNGNWVKAAPYHGGERNKYPYISSGHGRYAKGRLHGRIKCTLTSETPIFVGANRCNEGTEEEAARVTPYELGGQPAIPATSLRGMISSIAEAASHSAMRVLDGHRPMSYRMVPNEAYRNFGMILRKKDGAWAIRDLSNQKKLKFKTSHSIILDGKKTALSKLARSGKYPMERFYYRNPKNNNEFSSGQKTGWIRGKFRIMDARKREFPSAHRHWDFFIEIPEGIDQELIYELPTEVIDQFHAMADDAAERANKSDMHEYDMVPYHPLGTRRDDTSSNHQIVGRFRLKVGDLVYFSKSGKEAEAISLSAIWRGSKGLLSEFVSDKELLPFRWDRQFISPAERVFGFVEDRPSRKRRSYDDASGNDMAGSYAGHVRIGTARWNGKLPDGVKSPYMPEVVLKILDSPKPPSPALYFRNRNGSGGYTEKKNLKPRKHVIQGRKFYLHKKDLWADDQPWRTAPQKLKERLKQKTCITPLCKGLVFSFEVEFDNLSKFELGMLLYALRPADTFRHKIGMGKPLGLGTVRIDIEEVALVDPAKRYCEQGPFAKNGFDEREVKNWQQDYLKPFRDEMLKISKHAIESLELIGDPGGVKHPVHYPQVANHDLETENYKWWVANDNPRRRANPPPEGKQHLKPLDEITESKLPHLKRLRFKS